MAASPMREELDRRHDQRAEFRAARLIFRMEVAFRARVVREPGSHFKVLDFTRLRFPLTSTLSAEA